MSILNYLNDRKTSNGFCLLALIDPDKKNDLRIDAILSKINSSPFDAILIGGSSIEDNFLEKRIAYIKSKTTLPLISFPGSSNQISEQIDSMLYLNLISGRNPKYLIDEQVKGAKKIKKIGIETIPTAYILLDGGNTTSVSSISETSALSMDDKSNILSHALAGQFMGNRLIYFDCGSGSHNSITCELLDYIYQNINIPIIVGGGIKSIDDIHNLLNAGADKVALNTNAVKDPDLIYEAARIFGSQCIVTEIQLKKQKTFEWEAFTESGREKHNLNVLNWSKKAQDLGSGEILLLSIDNDGMRIGTELELIKLLKSSLSIPLIAGGGIGSVSDVEETIIYGNADAVSISHAFHFGLFNIKSLKNQLSKKLDVIRL